MNKILFSSNKSDWCTPIDLFESLNNTYHFNIDLCADKYNHLCEEYYSSSNSCFDLYCSGKSIFCNPPYSRGLYKFIEKCYDLSKNNTVVALLPARTDTKWFHEFIYKKAKDIIFLKGRLKFSDSKNSAPFPSMIIIF